MAEEMDKAKGATIISPEFEKELEVLLNKHSQENGSNTPDFILAKYLTGCLRNFNEAVLLRTDWYKPDKEKEFSYISVNIDVMSESEFAEIVDVHISMRDNVSYEVTYKCEFEDELRKNITFVPKDEADKPYKAVEWVYNNYKENSPWLIRKL